MRGPLVVLVSLAALVSVAAAPALAQGPTESQREAMRAACPADFRTYCAGVQPGTMAALQCLQTNEAKLSVACQSAVKAVGK